VRKVSKKKPSINLYPKNSNSIVNRQNEKKEAREALTLLQYW
jgi:hypothetical protein